jgi:hypothetical protein
MEYLAITVCLTGALACFMWLLTRNDHSSIYWAREVKRIGVGSDGPMTVRARSASLMLFAFDCRSFWTVVKAGLRSPHCSSVAALFSQESLMAAER